MTAFTIGEIVETTRATRADGGGPERFSARRFVVHGISAGGWLYVHPADQTRGRWNEWLILERDASRPAPGELEKEYGR